MSEAAAMLDSVRRLDRLALNAREVAELLGVSTATVKRMTLDDEIPSVMLRGSRRYPRAGIEAWLMELAGRPR